MSCNESDKEFFWLSSPCSEEQTLGGAIWKAQFKAYAYHKKFLDILLGTEVSEKLTDKEEICIRKASNTAYASLIIVCKGGAFAMAPGILSSPMAAPSWPSKKHTRFMSPIS